MKKIAFLGGASWKKENQVYKDAFETAKILAENGYQIINGGGPGVMKAASEGAKTARGIYSIIAITYHPHKKKTNFKGVDYTNPFDEEIVTTDFFDRTKVMLQNTDLHIVFNGSTGTISEFGMTWASSRIHEGNNKPIILFGDFWRNVIKSFEENLLMRPGEVDLLKICTTPEEVLEYVKEVLPQDSSQITTLAN